MKRILLALAPLALLLSLSTSSISAPAFALTAPHLTAASTAVTHAQRGQPDPATIIVYVTRSGAKYHRDGCRYLSKSKIPMSLKDAAKKYGPCSICKPPTLPK